MENKKFNVNKGTTFAIVFFMILCIIIVLLIVKLANPKDNSAVSETATPTNSPEATATAGNETTAPTLSPTATAMPTATPTAIPTPTPTIDPSAAARIVDPDTIDYSFLSEAPNEKFQDCTDNYDWYPGVYKYSDGKVTMSWDRYSSTLNWLNRYHGVYVKNTTIKAIYLTFDCGYENGNTEKILDVLKAKGCSGIFFVTGDYVENSANKSILKRILNEGSLIGSHTDNHKIMPTLSNEEFVKELNGVYQKLKDVLGDDFVLKYYRPPQGAATPRDLALADYLGYKTTFWSFAYGDYNPDNQPTAESALTKMKSSLRPGAVYLLHAVSSTNASVLGEFIDWVRDEGYEIRRIDQ